jgi:putative membrane protein
MEPSLAASVGVRPALAPRTAAVTLGFVLGGVALGTCSGLVPGLHANALAFLLAAAAPALPGAPAQVGAAMLAAGVVHTFLDVVPALALGVPDASLAAGALPGHRLVLAGRGREAVRLSAAGSGLAVAAAVPLAVPVTLAARAAYPTLVAGLPVVLAAVVVALLAGEPDGRSAAGGALAVLASSALGAVALDLSPAAPVDAGGVLTPLFAGLFGAPVLVDAYGGGGVPPQDDARLRLRPRGLVATAVGGTGAGALVGYLPGVSAGVAATLSLPVVPERGPRGFIVASSGANTATTVFALFALAALGTPRTGVLVAVSDAGAADALPTLVVATVVAAACGFALTLAVGDAYLRAVGGLDPRAVVVAVLALLTALSWLFAGVTGLGLFVLATVVGLVPPRVGCRRVHLMGVLVGPLFLRSLGA